jgi:hypothetical protein
MSHHRLRRRYGRSQMQKTEAVRIYAELRSRGFKEPAAHADAFVAGGYTLAQLLATEAKYGRFPLSSPAGPLVRKRVRLA